MPDTPATAPPSARQLRAVQHRVEHPGAPWAATAEVCGCNERSVRRWFATPSVRDAYERAARHAYEHALSQARALTLRAVGVIAAGLRGDATGVQVKCALGLLATVTASERDGAVSLAQVRLLLAALEAVLTRHAPPDVCERVLAGWAQVKL